MAIVSILTIADSNMWCMQFEPMQKFISGIFD